jgi:hypothetical protein
MEQTEVETTENSPATKAQAELLVYQGKRHHAFVGPEWQSLEGPDSFWAE